MQIAGKDTQFLPSDNDTSQLEFGHFGRTDDTSQLENSSLTAAGGLEELAVRPPSGQSCGVSISAKPAGKEAKPAEPTTPAPGGMDSEKWTSAKD